MQWIGAKRVYAYFCINPLCEIIDSSKNVLIFIVVMFIFIDKIFDEKSESKVPKCEQEGCDAVVKPGKIYYCTYVMYISD